MKEFNWFRDQHVENMERMFAAVSDLYAQYWNDFFHFAIFEDGEDRDSAFLRTHRRYAAALQVWSGSKVLELACGRGGFADFLAGETKAEVLGIDISRAQLRHARRYQRSNLRFLHHNIMEVQGPNARYDAVVLMDADAYLPDKKDLNKKVRPNWELGYERAIQAIGELTLAKAAALAWRRPPPGGGAALPLLESLAVFGGGETTARFAAGAIAAGSAGYATEFSIGTAVTIEGEIMPDAGHIGLPAELFVVVKLTTASEFSRWFVKNVDGNFLPWNRDVSGLEPAHLRDALGDSVRLRVYEGALPVPGKYAVFFGYMAEGDALIYSASPFVVEVTSN